MRKRYEQKQRRFRCVGFYQAMPWLLLSACDGTMPSTRLQNGVSLPIPASAMTVASPDRLSRVDQSEVYRLSPQTLILIAFNRQPDIKSSYQRFKSEEARYDFFVVSRDSLTPQLSTSHTVSEERDGETVQRNREHQIALSVEKKFFDTTELNVGVGLQTDVEDRRVGYHPFVSADLRYPLWVSRQKLERTSEEIFRRNELNDAQLGYIQEARQRLQWALFRFYDVLKYQREVDNAKRWQQDLESLLERLNTIQGRDVTTDRLRLEAEIGRARARVNELIGQLEVQREHLKANCGLPFHVNLELVDEPFNPFEGMSHEELLQISIETDPEIATLRNESRNAEVQLDLARRGRWDVTLQLKGESSFEGAGEDQGTSGWSTSIGLDVSAVDPRVTTSLARQAEARIARFQQAIVARENAIFVDTFEPITRIDTLTMSRDTLASTLPDLRQDYLTGIEAYVADTLNINDLLSDRRNLFRLHQNVSDTTFRIGANVAELCAATGKFFDLIGHPDGE